MHLSLYDHEHIVEDALEIKLLGMRPDLHCESVSILRLTCRANAEPITSSSSSTLDSVLLSDFHEGKCRNNTLSLFYVVFL